MGEYRTIWFQVVWHKARGRPGEDEFRYCSHNPFLCKNNYETTGWLPKGRSTIHNRLAKQGPQFFWGYFTEIAEIYFVMLLYHL
jgi:hypothetical protein